MARPKKYDETQVIEQGMNLFWHRGFQATAMSDLIEATGLKPGSLYGAFGNKRTFYQTTLAHYFQGMLQAIDDVLKKSQPAQKTIVEFYDFFIDFCLQTPQGCFMVNALFETPAEDTQQLEQIRAQFSRVKHRLQMVIEQAQSEKVHFFSQDASRVAAAMLAHIYGLRGYAKFDPDHLPSLKADLLAMLMPPSENYDKDKENESTL
ncbi:MAG: TetR/AcrR family transcriptional regulator [Hydrogenovibrio sp.]